VNRDEVAVDRFDFSGGSSAATAIHLECDIRHESDAPSVVLLPRYDIGHPAQY